jgi:hypothetical protein
MLDRLESEPHVVAAVVRPPGRGVVADRADGLMQLVECFAEP